jgi:peptide/nickel transport system ATP-binding protein
VRDVSFSVDQGQTLCIVGESGCGKSLTALSLLGLLPVGADRRVNHLRFKGQEMSTLGEAELGALRGTRIAMIFQDPMTSLNPVFTVGTQLVDILLQHKKVTRREAVDRAKYLLKRVGISDPEARLKQYPHELSGGLRQRVMIAMALMCGPELLIADEPTTALDVTVQAELLDLLKDIQQEYKLGLIFISHDLGLVAKIADHVMVMYAGEVVEAGPASEVFSNPLHPYTELLLRCIPRPGHTVPKSALSSIPGSIPPFEEEIVGCAFYDRCPTGADACKQPRLRLERQDAHQVLCIKPGSMRMGDLR